MQFHPNKNSATGALYDYADVPSEIFAALMASTSKGSYFISQIKQRYAYKRIEEAPAAAAE